MCWPAILRRKSNYRIHIFNASAEGRTTGEETFKLVARCLTAARIHLADCVFIMLGTNDAKACYGPAPPLEIRNNLEKLIDRILGYNADIHIVVLMPPPMGPIFQGDLFQGDIRVRSYCREFYRLCRERNLPVVDIHSILNVKEDLEQDLVHLNVNGRRKVANASWDYIRRHIPEVI